MQGHPLPPPLIPLQSSTFPSAQDWGKSVGIPKAWSSIVSPGLARASPLQKPKRTAFLGHWNAACPLTSADYAVGTADTAVAGCSTVDPNREGKLLNMTEPSRARKKLQELELTMLPCTCSRARPPDLWPLTPRCFEGCRRAFDDFVTNIILLPYSHYVSTQ